MKLPPHGRRVLTTGHEEGGRGPGREAAASAPHLTTQVPAGEPSWAPPNAPSAAVTRPLRVCERRGARSAPHSRPTPGAPRPSPRPTRPPSPSSSSLTSRAAFSPSSRRFRSIILLLSTAALSSALRVQPMVPGARGCRRSLQVRSRSRNTGASFLSGRGRPNRSRRRPHRPHPLPQPGEESEGANGTARLLLTAGSRRWRSSAPPKSRAFRLWAPRLPPSHP